jgi:hypothetical protein
VGKGLLRNPELLPARANCRPYGGQMSRIVRFDRYPLHPLMVAV